MNLAQLSPLLYPPQDTTASMASHSSFLSIALLSEPAVTPYVSFLDYVATVSLSDFLALYWLRLLSATPSARSCQVRDGIFQLLTNLLGVLRKAFLLLYQRTYFAALLLVFQRTSFTAAASNETFLIRTNSDCHYNSAYLLAPTLSTTITGKGTTTDSADSPLPTANFTGVSTGNPTLAPPTWVNLFQIYFRFSKHYLPLFGHTKNNTFSVDAVPTNHVRILDHGRFPIYPSALPPVHHYNHAYLLAPTLSTDTERGMTTDSVASPLTTAKSTGVSTGNPTLAPPTTTWVDLHQIYFQFGTTRTSGGHTNLNSYITLRTCGEHPSADNNNQKYTFGLTTCNCEYNSFSIDTHATTSTIDHDNNCLCTVYTAFAVAPTAALHCISFSKHATTLTITNNNNNTTCNCPVFNAFAVAITVAFATNHDRLLDHGRVLYLIILQILFVIYNTNLTIAIAIAIAPSRSFYKPNFLVAVAVANIGIMNIRFIHLQDIDIACATGIGIGIGIDVAIAIAIAIATLTFLIVVVVAIAIAIAIAVSVVIDIPTICKSKTCESNFIIDIAVALAIADAFIFLSSLEDQGRVLYCIVLGIMQIRFINLQDIDIAFAIGIDVAVAVAIAEFYESTTCESNFSFPSRSFYKSNFTFAIANAEFHESNFIIAIVTAIAFATAVAQRPSNSLSCLASNFATRSKIYESHFIIAIAIAIAIAVALIIEVAVCNLCKDDIIIATAIVILGDFLVAAFAIAIAIAIAEFYDSTIALATDVAVVIAVATSLLRSTRLDIAVAIVIEDISQALDGCDCLTNNFAIAIAIAIAALYNLTFYELTIYESNFVIAIAVLANAIAFATATAIATNNDYLAIAVTFAIAFVIPVQSETVLSSLIYFDDSIPQVLVGTNELHNDLRKRRSTTSFAFTYCTKPFGWVLHSRHAPRLMGHYG